MQMTEESKSSSSINEIIDIIFHKHSTDTLNSELEDGISIFPKSKAAVFWDYENFPIPKEFSAEVFFETLFPSGRSDEYVIKRVYGRSDIISPDVKQILEQYGFEYIKGLDTGKSNATDFILSSDCASCCAQRSSPLVVILISGDADFIPLIQILSSQGHEIRLICQEKKQISPDLHRVVPTIIDRQEIIKGCRNLNSVLLSLSQIISYAISNSSDQSISIEYFVKEIEKETNERTLKRLPGRLKFLFKAQGSQWQYEHKRKLLSNSPLALEVNPRIPDPERFIKRKNGIVMKLGSEPNEEQWETYWKEFQVLVPNINEQTKVIRNIYTASNLPLIRTRLQQKLIDLTLDEQGKVIDFSNLSWLDTLTSQWKCIKCQRTFGSELALKQHRKSVHSQGEKEDWKCKSCSRKFKTENALKQHKKTAHAPTKQVTSFICPTCGINFETDQALYQHKQAKHETKIGKKKRIIQCSQCDKKFETNTARDQHIKTKHQSQI